MEERIQKILARAGFGSRRSSEELISAGRIKINGVTAILGSKADLAVDKITVDGQAIPSQPIPNIYIALNKPHGILSDEDPQDSRPTVRDLVEVPGHLFTVGRLDLESEGLILLTNDGEMANRLTHPRYGHEKEYKVLVSSRPDEKQLKAWRYGVVMEDGYKTAPAGVSIETLSGKGTWLRIILREGKKRQIREVGKILGLHVVKILRIRIGGLLLGNLKPREWRYLTPEEVEGLTKISGKSPRFYPRAGIKNSRRSSTHRTEGTGQSGDARRESNLPSRKSPFQRTDGKSETASGGASRKGPLQKRSGTGRPERTSSLKRTTTKK
jgi:23S rRNA pseudouridine2605 synthase